MFFLLSAMLLGLSGPAFALHSEDEPEDSEDSDEGESVEDSDNEGRDGSGRLDFQGRFLLVRPEGGGALQAPAPSPR
jgi:hypothetical protein